jgi:predicted phosphodiesterase
LKLKARGIIVPDTHFPLQDNAAVNCVVKAIEKIEPSIFVNLGDVGEWESVSAWRYKDKKLPPLEYQLPIVDEEIRLVNEGLDIWDEVLDKIGCKKKYLLQGNHDIWLDNFVAKYPYMYNYSFFEACKIKERGYSYTPYNLPITIGAMTFFHGAFATTYHAKKHLDAYGANVMYGHTHDIQRHTQTKLGGTISAWGMGCLKNMSHESNKWLKGRLHNWAHAFAVIDWFTDGTFKVEVVEIKDGKTSLWGEVIDGNE